MALEAATNAAVRLYCADNPGNETWLRNTVAALAPVFDGTLNPPLIVAASYRRRMRTAALTVLAAAALASGRNVLFVAFGARALRNAISHIKTLLQSCVRNVDIYDLGEVYGEVTAYRALDVWSVDAPTRRLWGITSSACPSTLDSLSTACTVAKSGALVLIDDFFFANLRLLHAFYRVPVAAVGLVSDAPLADAIGFTVCHVRG